MNLRMVTICIGLFFTLIHCQSSTERGKARFFDFDQVDYYTIEISDNESVELLKDTSYSLKRGIVIDSYPEKKEDLENLNQLESLGFVKTELSSNQQESVNMIFLKKSGTRFYTSCISIFRDILVFKKNSKVVGVAKICFECSDNKIFGSAHDVSSFGQKGDYKKLREVLYN